MPYLKNAVAISHKDFNSPLPGAAASKYSRMFKQKLYQKKIFV